MPLVRFHGRVLPESQKITIVSKPTISWHNSDNNLTMEFVCDITDSLIDVQCTMGRWEDNLLPDVYRRAVDLSRASVELVCFAKGCALSIYFDSFTDHEGCKRQLLLQDQSLSSLVTAYSLDKDFESVQKLVLEEPNLFMALHDLIEAISIPHASLVNCARGIERIKHLLAASGQNDNQAWETMRNTLNIDKNYLMYVTGNSKDSRHGRGSYVDGTITTEVTRRAWTILNRYLLYKINGDSLPVSTPTLS
jgi:hypothetical protein